MAKKLRKLILSIGTSDRRVEVELDNCDGENGYFLGSVQMGGNYTPCISFHVEAIEAKLSRNGFTGAPCLEAVNQDYQNRINNYENKNEGSMAHLVKMGKKKYFIHIEPYAQ
jgi:hypothetical protein